MMMHEVCTAHERQPQIEKQFRDTKEYLEIAPVLLKSPARIEAFFLMHCLALLVMSLIEPELRRAMKREYIHHLPLYPEERTTTGPSAEQVLKLYAHAQHHTITKDGVPLHAYEPELTSLHRRVLDLLNVPASRYEQPA